MLLSPWDMPVDKQPVFSTCLNICPGEICLGFQAHAPLSLRWALVGEADRPTHRASSSLILPVPGLSTLEALNAMPASGSGTRKNRDTPNRPLALLPTPPLGHLVGGFPAKGSNPSRLPLFYWSRKKANWTGGSIFKLSMSIPLRSSRTSVSRGQSVCWVKPAKGTASGPSDSVSPPGPVWGSVTPSACSGGLSPAARG